MKKRSFRLPLLLLVMLILVTAGTSMARSALSKKNNPKGNKKGDISSVIEQELLNEIQKYGQQHDIAPIDAKIDRVWKAIPGYNGIAVDIEASLDQMKKGGKFDESKIVFKEIPPAVHLKDLEPQPIYRGNPQKPMVAFLINVAWGDEYIPQILEVLKNHKVKSTFFFDGSWVKRTPDIAKTIKEAGHEIGNHAYSHPDLSQYSEAGATEELQKTNEVIEETIGVKPQWFAPPSGSFNEGTVRVAHQLGMKTILWTADTVDWRKPDTQEMVNRVLGQVENGTMILMHPTKPTAEGINTMIAEIKGRGYKLGTVSDLMDEKRIDQNK